MRSEMSTSSATMPRQQLRYQSIRATAKTTGLSAYSLRKWHREGKLPGIQCGTKFMVDVFDLQEAIQAGSL